MLTNSGVYTMKFTVLIMQRGRDPQCSGLLHSRISACFYMDGLFRQDLKFEGLSDEAIDEAAGQCDPPGE